MYSPINATAADVSRVATNLGSGISAAEVRQFIEVIDACEGDISKAWNHIKKNPTLGNLMNKASLALQGSTMVDVIQSHRRESQTLLGSCRTAKFAAEHTMNAYAHTLSAKDRAILMADIQFMEQKESDLMLSIEQLDEMERHFLSLV